MSFRDWFAGVPTPVLNAERITLRAPSAADYDEWRTLREASRAFLTPWEPSWASDELSRSPYAGRLARYRQDARDRLGHAFFMFENESGRLCGGITLGQIRRGVAQSATFGYWMGEPFAGRGLMAQAVRSVSEYAFEAERLHRIEAACLPNNARSIGLLEKCGFTLEGHLRKYLMIAGVWQDHRLYSLLAEDRAASSRLRSHALPSPDEKVVPIAHA